MENREKTREKSDEEMIVDKEIGHLQNDKNNDNNETHDQLDDNSRLSVTNQSEEVESLDHNDKTNGDNVQEESSVKSKGKSPAGVKSRVISKRSVSLPLTRIKQIMKMDPEVNMASSESVFLITKCAEIFVEMLSKEAFSYTSSLKKKTVQKRDVDSAISNSEQLSFLEATFD